MQPEFFALIETASFAQQGEQLRSGTGVQHEWLALQIGEEPFGT